MPNKKKDFFTAKVGQKKVGRTKKRFLLMAVLAKIPSGSLQAASPPGLDSSSQKLFAVRPWFVFAVSLRSAYVAMPYVVIACIVMAYIVIAYIVMAYIVMAYIVMAYIVMAYLVMAYIVMAYTVMAYIVMA